MKRNNILSREKLKEKILEKFSRDTETVLSDLDHDRFKGASFQYSFSGSKPVSPAKFKQLLLDQPELLKKRVVQYQDIFK